ncbi:MAG: ABC transporter substrate-binding protein [Rhodovibrionaceae bacterium]
MTSGISKKLLAGVMAAGLLGAAPALAQDATIGSLVPVTGDLQAYGPNNAMGAELAAKHVNDQGGLLDGGTLSVAIGDTQTNAQAGVDAAQKLVSVDGVVGIVGALSSGVSGPVATSVTGPAGIPQISPASTAPVLTTIEDNDFFFRTTPHDALQGVVLAQVAKDAGYNNLAVIYINNDYGEGLANAFSDAYKELGGEVSASLAYEIGNASYRGELQNAAGGGGEALVLIGYPENGITIIRQALEGGFFEKFIFTDGMRDSSIVEASGDYLNGSIGTNPAAVADNPATETFSDLWKEAYGEEELKPFTSNAYDGAFILALAIEKAGSTDPKAIRDAMRAVAGPPGEKVLPGEWAKAKELIAAGTDIDYDGAAGSQDFDDAGDVPGTFAHWTIENGEIKTVDIIAPK